MKEPVYQIIQDKISGLAVRITQLQFEKHPELLKRYGPAGKKRCHEDAVFHLEFFIEALKLDHRDMYGNYILWAAAMLGHRNIPKSDLEYNLQYLQQAILEVLDTDYSNQIIDFIEFGRNKLNQEVTEPTSYITEENPFRDEARRYLEYLLDGQREKARSSVHELVEKGTNIKDIYHYIFQPTQYEVGHLWQCNKITVAHEHYCSAATQLIMSGLYPHIFSTRRIGKTMVACSISGELHEMGIRMVSDFFEIEGWDTYYLGANMPDRQLEQAVADHKANLLAISVTLPIHVSKAAALIKQIRSNRELSELKILVGGYPFIQHPDLWKKIDADGFAENANQAIMIAEQLTS